jgi:ATP-dependent Clp protease ATP-binding subunit ClpA
MKWPTSSACSPPSSAIGSMPSFPSVPLDAEIILRVVDKFLMQLEGQLHEKEGRGHLHRCTLRAWLAEKGFDPLMGARPMARLIQDTIRSALADELLFGQA